MEDTPVPNVHPRCFSADREGGIWDGTNGNGLIHVKHRMVHMFTRADRLITRQYGHRNVGGCNCGFSVYDGKRFESYIEKDGLSNSCVWSLAEDQNRKLWIGTHGGGLFRFRDGHFVQYSLEQGRVSKIVVQIAVAHDGSIWIATPDGISRMRHGHFRKLSASLK